MEKALVLHSGGIDSTTCLAIAIEAHGKENVTALSMNYGQRHLKEIKCAREVARKMGVVHRVQEIKDIFPTSMLTDVDSKVPDISYDEIQGVSPTYVPFRNGTLLSVITAIAQGRGFSFVYFGAHAEDAANWAYPDCTPEFIGAMANAIYIGTYHKVRLLTPLQWLTKKGVISIGYGLKVPYELTWSCYKGEELQCGICPTCRSRRQGFIDANIHDRTQYTNMEAL